MRGLAALAVTWFHLTNSYKGGFVAESGTYGWLGVDVFFVISGFVIPYSIAQTYANYSLSEFPNFVLRRLVRLEPPYLLSIVVVVVLGYLSTLAPDFHGASPDFSARRVAAHLLYLIPFTTYGWLQPVYWTLAYEFAFYLLVGVMFPLVGPQENVFASVSLSLAIGIAILVGVLPQPSALFLLGFVVFKCITAGGSADCRQQARLAWALVVCGAGLLLLASGGLTALIGLGSAAAIYALVQFDGLNGRLGRALLGLGTISYSLYLLHIPVGGRVVNLGSRFVSEPYYQLVLSSVALVACLLAAALFYAVVERPAVQIARRLRPRRPAQEHDN